MSDDAWLQKQIAAKVPMTGREERELMPMSVKLSETESIDFHDVCKELACSLADSFEHDETNNDIKGTLLAVCREVRNRNLNWLQLVDAVNLCVTAERTENFGAEEETIKAPDEVH